MLEEYTRHLIVVTMKKQKLEEEGKSANECTVNKSLNCLIIFMLSIAIKITLTFLQCSVKKTMLNESNLSFPNV